MPLISWSNDMSVGNSMIDGEHRQWIAIINKLGDAMKDGAADAVMGEIIAELAAYTTKHFRDEENLFSKTAYPNIDAHKAKHKFLVDKIDGLRKEHQSNQIALGVKILNFLKEWLVEHIMKTDKTYMKYIA